MTIKQNIILDDLKTIQPNLLFVVLDSGNISLVCIILFLENHIILHLEFPSRNESKSNPANHVGNRDWNRLLIRSSIPDRIWQAKEMDHR